jgi:hypothetical protein
MQQRRVDDWLSSFVEYASESEAPKIYLTWVGISCIASALQRKARIYWDSWTYPNMYIVLVGPPASRKGTAMRFGKTILEKAMIKLSCDSVSRKGFMEDLRSATNKDFLTIDTKTQMVHSSLTVFSEEFVVFLGADRQFLMDLVNAYDCPDIFKHRTQGGGVEEIQGVWVNILGAITPTLLQATLPNDSAGTGLMSRLIIAYSRRKDKKVIYPFLIKEKEELQEKLVGDLQDIFSISGDYQVSDDFLELWGEWYGSYDEFANSIDPKLLGYSDRKAKHVIRLSMILSASRSSDMIITGSDLRRALSILELTEKSMPLALAGVGKSKTADTTNTIMLYLRERGSAYLSELMSRNVSDVTYTELKEIIAAIYVMGNIEINHDNPKDDLIIWRSGK